jgi:hypothetical protein
MEWYSHPLGNMCWLSGHKANGFGRGYLHEWEAQALYEAGYMASAGLPVHGTWRLSAGGIPIPPVPHDAARSAAIHRHYYDAPTCLGPRQQGPVDSVLYEPPQPRASAIRGQRPSAGQQAKAVVGIPGRTLAFISACISLGFLYF